MLTTPGFRMDQVIYEDPHILVGYAYPVRSFRRTLLKVVKNSKRALIENAKLLNEHNVASRLEMEGILRPVRSLASDDGAAMEYAPINGMTLRRYMTERCVSTNEFLELGMRISSLLQELHRQEIVHLNLRPDTILIHPETQRLYLTGFGHAVHIPSRRGAMNSALLEANPLYMSPEQTGRMNHGVDYRADLYSLGVSFYEMLTGNLPFTAPDALGWSHAHMAQSPVLPSAGGSPIPQSLSAILLKMLAKDPEERFQDAEELLDGFKSSLAGREYEDFLEQRKPTTEALSITAAEPSPEQSTSYPQELDMAAMIRSSQLFSSETDELRILRELMSLIVQHAGAERGTLVSCRNGESKVEWTSEIKHGQWASSRANIPLDHFPQPARDVIMKSIRNRQAIRISGSESLLSLPIAVKNKIIGCLVLENKLASKAFVSERFPVWQRLASQALFLVKLASREDAAADPRSDMASLSAREIEVLRLIAGGLSNIEIAERLTITPETVKTHVRSIFRKLKTDRRIKAVAAAKRLGLLEEGEDHPFGG